jgi:lysophospholipase L1-like esterase
MRFRVPLALAVLAVALVVVPGAPAASKATYYVSLGDSLAQGYQPIGGPLQSGSAPPGYNHGYADQLFKLVRDRYTQLQEVKLGCGGATTVSMRIGGGFCAYPEGTQLAEAVAFLQEHAGDVAFVTIDIGANDLLGGGGVAAVAANLPPILDALRAAAGPNVPILGMNYYDPFVAPVWFQKHSVAAVQAEVTASAGFNTFLEGIYGAFGMPVADVESAFSLTNVTIQPSGLPLDVEVACAWTWICAADDIHANNAGYAAIAQAFEEVLPGA